MINISELQASLTDYFLYLMSVRLYLFATPGSYLTCRIGRIGHGLFWQIMEQGEGGRGDSFVAIFR